MSNHKSLGNFELDTTWAVVNDDAGVITNKNSHVEGIKSISFDKLNGTANTTKAIIESTIESVDIRRFSQEARIVSSIHVSALTDIVDVFIRLGVDNTNYSQWTFLVADLTGGAIWELLSKKFYQVDWAVIGNGMNPASITYIAVGVTFNSETNTLTGIGWDNVNITT